MTDHDATNGAGSQPPREDSPSTGAREAAWDDVAAHFSNLGKQLRSRFERPAGEAADEPPVAGEAGTGREGAGGEVVRRWIDTLDDTFTKLGDTVRDPEFRKEAGSSVSRLGQALGVTLRELGDQLQGRFGRGRADTTPSAPGEDMPDVPPPPTPPSSEVPPTPPTPPSSEVPPASPAAPPPPSSEVPPPAPGIDTGDQPQPEERPPAP